MSCSCFRCVKANSSEELRKVPSVSGNNIARSQNQRRDKVYTFQVLKHIIKDTMEETKIWNSPQSRVMSSMLQKYLWFLTLTRSIFTQHDFTNFECSLHHMDFNISRFNEKLWAEYIHYKLINNSSGSKFKSPVQSWVRSHQWMYLFKALICERAISLSPCIYIKTLRRAGLRQHPAFDGVLCRCVICYS